MHCEFLLYYENDKFLKRKGCVAVKGYEDQGEGLLYPGTQTPAKLMLSFCVSSF